MAVDQHTTSRRGMLGALALSALLPSITLATPAATSWHAARASFIAARAAEDHYDRTVAGPIWAATDYVDTPASISVTNESDRLCDIRCQR